MSILIKHILMQIEDRKIIDAIIVELNHFKFGRSSISYQYLIDAIYLVVKSPNAISNFKQKIYAPIAKKYSTRPENINWSIAKLIDLMYSNTPAEVIYEYFKFFMDEKPTPKFFIVTVARNIFDNQLVFN